MYRLTELKGMYNGFNLQAHIGSERYYIIVPGIPCSLAVPAPIQNPLSQSPWQDTKLFPPAPVWVITLKWEGKGLRLVQGKSAKNPQ